jgi:hypothetical protein
VAPVVFTAAVLAGAVGAAAPSKHVTIVRHSGPVEATVAYDTRRETGGTALRGITLTVRRGGTVTLTRRLGGLPANAQTIVELTLRDVWGDAEPEALLKTYWCGNRCGVQLYVALRAGPSWRVAHHDFGGMWPGAAWRGRWYHGRFEFLSYDLRFFCYFTSCAGSWGPPLVFALGPRGRGFVDVTRSRRDLVGADARKQWREYLAVRRRGSNGYDTYVHEVLGLWCADQYRLGRGLHCDRVLRQQLARGYLGRGGRGFIRELHAKLVAWGYARA